MIRKSGITGTSSKSFNIDTDGYNIKLSAEDNKLVIRNSSSETTNLSETSGGTGQTSYSTGDMLYADGTDSLGKLSVGNDGYVLTVVDGNPSWAAGSTGPSIPLSQTLVAASSSTSNTVWTAIGGGVFDPSIGTSTNFNFRVLLSSTSGLTANIRLYNLSDAIEVCTMTTTAATPTLLSYNITVGASFPNSSKNYSVQIKLSSGSSPDFATCLWAEVRQA
ncbi:MAG: hypothetical protein ACOYO1_05220 [Bacteroidales bacterium]